MLHRSKRGKALHNSWDLPEGRKMPRVVRRLGGSGAGSLSPSKTADCYPVPDSPIEDEWTKCLTWVLQQRPSLLGRRPGWSSNSVSRWKACQCIRKAMIWRSSARSWPRIANNSKPYGSEESRLWWNVGIIINFPPVLPTIWLKVISRSKPLRLEAGRKLCPGVSPPKRSYGWGLVAPVLLLSSRYASICGLNSGAMEGSSSTAFW